MTSPTLADLNARTQADITTRIQGASPTLSRSILGAIGRALVGACQALYGYIDNQAAQSTPYTATGTALNGWATLWLPGGRMQPTFATGSVLVTGAQGVVLPALSSLQSSSGSLYLTNADVTLGSNGSVTVAVTASSAALDGNVTSGTVLSFVSPQISINSTATVASGGITGGSDLESDDALRARMIARIQNPPHGGDAADYQAWALSVPNITRAWVFPLYNGPGTVRVYVADDNYTGPTLAAASDVANVQAYIDSVKPVGVSYLVGNVVTDGFAAVAPNVQPVNFTLTLGASSNTPAIQSQVQANLQDLFYRESAPEGTVRFHHILRAISEAVGDGDFTITAPTADITASVGDILTLGTITW